MEFPGELFQPTQVGFNGVSWPISGLVNSLSVQCMKVKTGMECCPPHRIVILENIIFYKNHLAIGPVFVLYKYPPAYCEESGGGVLYFFRGRSTTKGQTIELSLILLYSASA